MDYFFRSVSAVLLIGAFLLACISCNASTTLQKDAEGMSQPSTVAEAEAETEKPNPLAKIIYIGLDRHKGQCSLYWGERQGLRTGRSVTGATRFLYNTKKNSVYQEVKISSIGSADGTGVEIKEGNELKHLIIVFGKGYKLTENDKSVLAELGIDYMFEK